MQCPQESRNTVSELELISTISARTPRCLCMFGICAFVRLIFVNLFQKYRGVWRVEKLRLISRIGRCSRKQTKSRGRAHCRALPRSPRFIREITANVWKLPNRPLESQKTKLQMDQRGKNGARGLLRVSIRVIFLALSLWVKIKVSFLHQYFYSQFPIAIEVYHF